MTTQKDTNNLLLKQDFFKSNDKYKVGVVLTTYNHKAYIREALDSVLMQKVNFPYKLYVSDDCSTDGTSEIIQEYVKKYDFITVNRQKQNQGHDDINGGVFNYNDSKKRIDTEYVALLDGDDYWTDENKLQEQYDFLEKHRECVVVFDSQYRNSTDDPWILHSKLKYFPITDYSAYSQTSTIFYRNVVDFSLYPGCLNDDAGLPFIFLVYGKLGYRANITSVYRQHAQGCYTSLPQETKDAGVQILTIIALGFCIKHHINPKYIQKHLYDNATHREKLIARLQDKDNIDEWMSNNKLTIECLNTFKRVIKEQGFI